MVKMCFLLMYYINESIHLRSYAGLFGVTKVRAELGMWSK